MTITDLKGRPMVIKWIVILILGTMVAVACSPHVRATIANILT